MPEFNDDFVKKLSGYPEEKPDFNSMFRALQERKRKWERETGRQAVRVYPPFSKKARYMTAALVCVFGIAVFGVTAQQTGLLNKLTNTSKNQNTAVGQKLNAHTEQNGVKISLDRVISSPSTQKDGLTDLEYHLSLNVPGSSDYDFAFFDTGTLYNLDTEEKVKNIANQIKFTQQEGRLRSSFVPQSKLQSGISGRYELELQDLYLRKKVKIPLNGKLNGMKGARYELNEDRFPSLTIEASARVGNDWVVRYSFPQDIEPMKEFRNEWRNSTEPFNYGLVLVAGGRTLETRNSTGGGHGWSSETFDISGLSEQEIAEAQLYFTFSKTVKKVEGDWRLEFTVDEAQASQPTRTYPLQIDPSKVKGFDFVPTSLTFTPVSIIVPIPGYSKDHTAGKVLLDKVKLRVGNHTLTGGFLASDNRLMFMLDQPYQDFSNEPVTLVLDKAWVVYEDLARNWTTLKEPSEKEQTAEYRLDDDHVIQYKYYRKGNGLMVVTKLKEGSSAFSFQGTSLKVNGSMVEPSQNQSWSTEEKRVDYYDSVPEGAKLEINPGMYLVEDDSYTQEIKLK